MRSGERKRQEWYVFLGVVLEEAEVKNRCEELRKRATRAIVTLKSPRSSSSALLKRSQIYSSDRVSFSANSPALACGREFVRHLDVSNAYTRARFERTRLLAYSQIRTHSFNRSLDFLVDGENDCLAWGDSSDSWSDTFPESRRTFLCEHF